MNFAKAKEKKFWEITYLGKFQCVVTYFLSAVDVEVSLDSSYFLQDWNHKYIHSDIRATFFAFKWSFLNNIIFIVVHVLFVRHGNKNELGNISSLLFRIVVQNQAEQKENLYWRLSKFIQNVVPIFKGAEQLLISIIYFTHMWVDSFKFSHSQNSRRGHPYVV